MDAIIGRYRARIEETGFILKHASGINFDLTPDEALGLLDFLSAYQQTLSALQRETKPRIEGVVPEKDDN